MKGIDLEHHVEFYVGIVNLNIFVECARVYHVEVEILHSEGYLDVQETLHLSCSMEMAALTALEVMIERAAVPPELA
ncbi:hypothetical protein [Paenibacillus sp. J22TS3]|uniref:hypothetical protein n=1 Tax=Paenibacillus sp. J22TS3 TaxID=2807192 RepID=UPI001B19E6F9|nr:hypothetical protein [Paenibacillus sp. J22TS3]GIP20833.1 hypothetical protein J22TS3_11080 [Paenibacillus sp. J22TS3]